MAEPGFHAEIPGKNTEVFLHAEIRIQIIFLGTDTGNRFDLPWIPGDVHAHHRESARGHRQKTVDHLHRCRFPGAVGTQHTETLPGTDAEINAIHSSQCFKPLYQVFGCYDVFIECHIPSRTGKE